MLFGVLGALLYAKRVHDNQKEEGAIDLMSDGGSSNPLTNKLLKDSNLSQYDQQISRGSATNGVTMRETSKTYD